MALSELSEGKKASLKERIAEMTERGNSIRQIARMALKEFNVKLFDDRK